ncbi:MAG: thiamine-phosphate kinase [Planctomycetaceae bacterium]
MSDHSELALIDWIRQRATASPNLRLGIGDDCAIWQPGDAQLLFTTDVLMEDVDFRVAETTPQLIGRKSLAVNLSDIAAMAGRPRAALVGLVLPKSRGFDFARDLSEGLRSLADEFQVAIIGGDTNTWDGPLVISVTLIGEATERGAVRRSGAKPGDWLFVTGPLGGSIRGHHLTFTPRVREALELHRLADLHAMIDLSDGLAADLFHLLDESQVGATLVSDAIPISDDARRMNDGRAPLEHALSDGEDFELLFTVSPEDGARLLSITGFEATTHIGTIDAEPGCRIQRPNGDIEQLARGGWEHQF